MTRSKLYVAVIVLTQGLKYYLNFNRRTKAMKILNRKLSHIKTFFRKKVRMEINILEKEVYLEKNQERE